MAWCQVRAHLASSTAPTASYRLSTDASAAALAPAGRRFASSKKGSSASSNKWLQRQRRDPFVLSRTDPHKAKSLGLPTYGELTADPSSNETGPAGNYVSRAAFKLWQLEEQHRFLVPRRGSHSRGSHQHRVKSSRVVVDLGAAPGGWTQMASQILTRVKTKQGAARIFALDLLPLDPSVASLPGVDFLQGDFHTLDIHTELARRIQGQASDQSVQDSESNQSEAAALPTEAARQTSTQQVDVVLSDMMANTTGSSLRTTTLSLELVQSAFFFAQKQLKISEQSFFLAKIFQSPDADDWRKSDLEPRFERCKTEKVEGSRKGSREVYWVCRGFKG